jgi:hypothetical protein
VTAREQVNSWIRTSGAFDGVLDFDDVWRDQAQQPLDGQVLVPHPAGTAQKGVL